MDLISLRNNTPLTTTKVIEMYTGVKHQNILQLFRRHEKNIKEFGVIMFKTCKPDKGSKGGRPETFYYLNEEQFTFFVMLMANSRKVIELKIKLNKEFHKYKKMLLQIELNKKNEEWIKSRSEGKKARKEFTDILKDLLELTKEINPDSTYVKRPTLLYSNFTRMIYKNLYNTNIKNKNLRDSMNEKQLSILGVAELAALKSIQDELDKNNKDAKEIYKITNNVIEEYSKLIGKTDILELVIPNQISLKE